MLPVFHLARDPLREWNRHTYRVCRLFANTRVCSQTPESRVGTDTAAGPPHLVRGSPATARTAKRTPREWRSHAAPPSAWRWPWWPLWPPRRPRRSSTTFRGECGCCCGAPARRSWRAEWAADTRSCPPTDTRPFSVSLRYRCTIHLPTPCNLPQSVDGQPRLFWDEFVQGDRGVHGHLR